MRREDLQGALVEALFMLSILLDPLGRVGDVAPAERLVERLLPLLVVDRVGSDAETIRFALMRYAAVRADDGLPADTMQGCAVREMAVHRRDLARDRLRRALARLADLGVETRAPA